MNRIGLVWAFALVVPVVSLGAETHKAETHKKVQAAIDYNIPLNKCKKPRPVNKMTDMTDSEGFTMVWDVDSYQLNRAKRMEKRWQSCVEKYKRSLLEDFSELRDCAQHGLTRAQGNTILGKMADIQAVIMSADGIKPVDPGNS